MSFGTVVDVGGIAAQFAAIEPPFFSKVILKLAADKPALQRGDFAATLSTTWVMTKTLFQIEQASFTNRLENFRTVGTLDGEPHMPRAVPAPVAELFASRLAKKVRVRVPEIKLSLTEPLSANYVKRRGAAWIEGKPIPYSLPLYYIEDKFQTLPIYKAPATGYSNPDKTAIDFEISASNDMHEAFLLTLDKRCPVSRSAYSDFPIALESDSKILDAAKWDSDQKLLIHLYRAFLYASYAHNSNVLVDQRGNLHTIDFEKLLYTDGSDITDLHSAVRGSERIMRLASRISELQESDIVAALDKIPKFAWTQDAVITNVDDAAQYFTARLKRWKACFPADSACWRTVGTL